MLEPGSASHFWPNRTLPGLAQIEAFTSSMSYHQQSYIRQYSYPYLLLLCQFGKQ